MHLCVAGWMEGGMVGYPTRFPSVKCGDNHVGLVIYKEPVDQSSMYDAYCYRLKGTVAAQSMCSDRCRRVEYSLLFISVEILVHKWRMLFDQLQQHGALCGFSSDTNRLFVLALKYRPNKYFHYFIDSFNELIHCFVFNKSESYETGTSCVSRALSDILKYSDYNDIQVDLLTIYS